MNPIKYLLLLSVFTYLPVTYATDAALEKKWSDTLVRSAAEGEVVWLDMQGGKFLSLYREDTTGTLQGAAIILHSLGTHPDWPDVISPVRKALPAYGWATLSVQMPVMPMNEPLDQHATLFKESPQRIQAAISYLQNKGINNIVLIGHGLGAAMGAAFLAANEDTGIKAFIGISMMAYKGLDPGMYTPDSLVKIKLPVLDIYGSRDLDNVRHSSTARTNAARKSGLVITQGQDLESFRQSATAQAAFSKKTGFIAFRQVEIPGADHTFNGFEDILNKRIIGWLKRHAGGITLEMPRGTAAKASE